MSQLGRIEPSIGKVVLTRHFNEKENREYIFIQADSNQNRKNRHVAITWINQTFNQDSPYKSGMVSFSIEDWKATKGDEFVNAASKAFNIISWVDLSTNKKIFKGLSTIVKSMGGGVAPAAPMGGELPQNAQTPTVPVGGEQPSPEQFKRESTMTFKEYLDRANKKTRKSGPLRKFGIKSILGNPKLMIPRTGIEKIDRKRYT